MDPSIQPKRRSKRLRQRRIEAKSGSNTTIESLGNDVLADIIIRLPSPMALGRAALACPRWRMLVASRDFLCRHRALHPSPLPLIGCFFSAAYGLPVFHRIRDFPDRDLAAVVRGGDFSFTSFGDQWRVQDCRDGLFLLSNGDRFALFDPVSRRCVWIPISHRVLLWRVLCLLPSYSGDGVVDASFRVVSLNFFFERVESEEGGQTKNVRVRAHTYSSRTGGWHCHLCTQPLRWADFIGITRSQPMHAAERIYWKQDRQCNDSSKSELLISLNTDTMEFSYVAPPPVPGLSNTRYGSYVIGDTEDGACCLVRFPSREHDALQVWLRNEDEGSWELCWEIQASELRRCFSCYVPATTLKYQAAVMIAGVVLLGLDGEHLYGGHCYVALRIKTVSVDRGNITRVKEEASFFTGPWREAYVYPYFMMWPRPAMLQQPTGSS